MGWYALIDGVTSIWRLEATVRAHLADVPSVFVRTQCPDSISGVGGLVLPLLRLEAAFDTYFFFTNVGTSRERSFFPSSLLYCSSRVNRR